MGQENKKPTINKNTPTQGTFSASSSQTTAPMNEQEKAEIRAEYLAMFLQFSRALSGKFITPDQFLNNREYFYKSGKKYFSLDELKEIEEEAYKIQRRENYRSERDKLWEKYFEEKKQKGYENDDEIDTKLLLDLEWQLELLRENWNYEWVDENGSFHRTKSTDDETESNTENFSPPEDYSDDDETEQTADQSNEVKPVIPEAEILPDILPDTLPKKDKGKAKAVELETEPEAETSNEPENNDEIDDDELQEDWNNFWQAEYRKDPEGLRKKPPSLFSKEPEPKADEPEQSEPEASSSTQTNEQPKELSPESQQVLNKIQNIYFTDPAESGNQVEKIFAPEIKTFPEPKIKILKVLREAEHKLLGPVKIDNTNRLYKLSEKERQEKKNDYQGLDRILYDKLLEKVGTIQKPTKYLVANQIVESIAVATPFAGNAKAVIDINTYLSHIDNLQIGLEKSFSIAEVKEIVAQTRKADYEQLEAVKNWVIQMDNENNGLLKTTAEREAQKDKEFTDLQKQKAQEIANLQNNTSNQLKDKDTEIKKLKKQALDFIKQKQEIETKKAEALGQSKKLLESKEKVDLDIITEKYRILEQNATQQEELLQLKDKKITEFLAFIYQLKHEKEILGGEFSILVDRVLRIEAEKLLLDSELFAKSNELKRTIDEKDREIKRIEAKSKADLELKELEKTNQLAQKDRELGQKDLKLSQWDEWEIKRKGTIDQAEKDREQYRQDFLKIRDERDDLQNAISPQWLRKTFNRIDWLCGTELETSGPQIWARTIFWGKFTLIVLISAIFLLVISWIIRILIAIYRNTKAIFTKKQDTASILKELIGGMKQAKDNLTNKKPTEPAKEPDKTQPKPEPKNIIEILPEFTEAEKKENLRKLPPEERQIIKEAKKRAKRTKKKRTKRPKRTKEPTK